MFVFSYQVDHLHVPTVSPAREPQALLSLTPKVSGFKGHMTLTTCLPVLEALTSWSPFRKHGSAKAWGPGGTKGCLISHQDRALNRDKPVRRRSTEPLLCLTGGRSTSVPNCEFYLVSFCCPLLLCAQPISALCADT